MARQTTRLLHLLAGFVLFQIFVPNIEGASAMTRDEILELERNWEALVRQVEMRKVTEIVSNADTIVQSMINRENHPSIDSIEQQRAETEFQHLMMQIAIGIARVIHPPLETQDPSVTPAALAFFHQIIATAAASAPPAPPAATQRISQPALPKESKAQRIRNTENDLYSLNFLGFLLGNLKKDYGLEYGPDHQFDANIQESEKNLGGIISAFEKTLTSLRQKKNVRIVEPSHKDHQSKNAKPSDSVSRGG